MRTKRFLAGFLSAVLLATSLGTAALAAPASSYSYNGTAITVTQLGINVPQSLTYLGDGKTDFTLELTWLRDHPQKYDLGECEFHLAMAVEDMEKAHALHEKLGCICYENPAMGIYFISDPDGYWIEIVPAR